jgi:predicted acyl esterase
MRRRTVLLSLVALVATAFPLALASPVAAATPSAHGSVNQVYVTGATPGATLQLRRGGTTVATATADSRGTSIFGNQYGTTDDLPAGSYTVREGTGTPSAPVTVTDPDDVPAQTFYDDQDLPYGLDALGYGYVTMRDGTQLAMHAQPPLVDLNGPLVADPVLVNYSGYTPANPATAEPEPTLLAARLLGYGTVGVNMRGTGCSGGAFAFFEPLQATDGYDVVEAVAAQDWSANVGLFGISYPGISQLFTAAQQPPSLTAITPLSVIADTYRSTLYPGGILNNGFATDWAAERAHDSRPAPDGQPWANDRIANGDTTCEANQVLHGQAPSISDQLTQDKPYDPTWFDELAPRTFVDQIDVPVFLGGAWQDEQTGGHFPTMLDELAQNVPDLHVALTNGTHVESLGPDLIVSVFEFLDFYVAERRPLINPAARGVAARALYTEIFGEPYDIALDRNWPLDYDAALAQYQAEPAVRVLWERGAKEEDAVVCLTDLALGPACSPRTPLARYESTYAAWPPPEAQPRQLFLGPDGHLGGTAPDVDDREIRGWTPYEYDAAEVDQTRTFGGTTGEIWRTDAATEWPNPPAGEAASFTTDPLTEDLNILGSGSVDLWLRSTAPDVDVEVTLSEVRPDGQETYIQAGWLRASHRHQGAGSTALAPFHDHLGSTAAPLPSGRFARMRVELFPVAHVVRAGSRLQLTVDAPGGSRPFWKFDALDAPGAINDIGHSVGRPSHLTLSTVPDPGAPAELPPCESLRGQPCRDFVGLRAPTAVTAELDADARTVDVAWAPPASGGQVTGYTVTVLPTGQTADVPAGTTSWTHDLGDGPPPAASLAYRVTATFAGGDGPPSSPSLEVPGPNRFDDVSPDGPLADAVDWLDGYGIASGYADGTFRPAAPVTRQQMVRWLWITMGSPETDHQHGYADVAEGSWADAALDWADEREIVFGYGDGTFRPRASITRAQLSAWLWKLAGQPAAATPSHFGDVRPSAWFKPAVDWLVEHEVVAGFADGTFRPATSATRGQMASWLHRTVAARDAWG